MKFRIVRYKFLFLSLAFLIVSALLGSFFINERKSQQQFIANTEKKLNQQLEVLDQDLAKVARHIQTVQDFSFTALDIQTEYPFYIYNRGNLVYWSDFKFVPEYQSIAGNYDYRFITLRTGQYISHRIVVEKNQAVLELYSFLPIVHQSKIDNSYIESGLNVDIFSSSSLSIRSFPANGAADIHTDKGEYLFSVRFLKGFQYSPLGIKFLIVGLVSLSLVLMLVHISMWTRELEKKGKPFTALVLFSFCLVAIRGLMLTFNFPFDLTQSPLFNSRHFASSIFNPSLGDLLLNNLVLLAIAYLGTKLIVRMNVLRRMREMKVLSRVVAAVLLITLSYAALYFQFYIIRTLYFHSQWSLDITTDITFSSFKIISYCIFFINALVYFLVAHAIFKLVMQLVKGSFYNLMTAFGLGTLLFMTVAHLSGLSFVVVLVANFVYLCLLYFFKLPSSLDAVKYNTFLYFFASALTSAVVGASAGYIFGQQKSVNAKNQFANQLLIDNDIRGEYLLAEAAEKIKTDIFIKNRLYSPFYSKEIIEQKIRRVYLNNYLDRYDIQVYLFNAQGRPYNYQVPNFSVFINAFAHEQYETDYSGVYFINESPLSPLKRYLVFVDINRYGSTIGYVVLDLKLKKIIPNAVYPELIVDKRFVQSDEGDYSYGIFQNGALINNAGMFNYQKGFNESLLKDPNLFVDGIIVNGHHHLGITGGGERVVVVSSEVYPWRNVLANFSFLFLLLVFTTSLFILVKTIYNGRGKVNLNYASKIQLYLNLAFFLPLLIVSVTTLSLISSSYKKDIIQRYNKKAESLSTNIANSLDNYTHNRFGREQLSNELAQIARYSESDINLFSVTGRLITTSQPTIYENDLLSEYINPMALGIIKEQENDQVILEEKVGSLLYKSAYVAVKSFETGELMGVLSIPFFDSQYELEEEIIDIVANIMILFTFIFLAILIVSYFASHILTFPLKYITQKIKRTSLSVYNEPLVWNTKDEIGLLVGEYNRMLENLEESKNALTKSEKESAWREMAKQVAHEIKNPLTPMKLTLQHLNRILHEEKETDKDTIDRSINTLLQQIDTLSDIATSFSAFAQMPIPKQEPYEIVSVLKRTVLLFENEKNADIHIQHVKGEVYVEGDKQLMGRIFSNLIINGIQSVPASRNARVDIKLEVKGDTLFLQFKDNGEGIAEEIKEKVFVPNFSTKYAGSGIGLAIAKRGIEHAGGSIWFETEVGAGTVFYISLPIVS